MAFTFSENPSVQQHPGYFLELAQIKLTGLGVIRPDGELVVLHSNDRQGAARALQTAKHIYAIHDKPEPPLVAEIQERIGR